MLAAHRIVEVVDGLAERLQSEGQHRPVAVPAGEVHRLPGQLGGLRAVVRPDEPGQVGQGDRTGRRRSCPCEGRAEPPLALVLVPGLEPQHHRVHHELQVLLAAPRSLQVVDGRAQVVGVGDGLLQPGGGVGSLAVPGQVDRPSGVVVGRSSGHRCRVAFRLELVGREVADRHEHPEPRTSVQRGSRLDEVAVDQVHEDVDDRSLQIRTRDGGDGVEIPAPAQHRQAGEQVPLLRR